MADIRQIRERIRELAKRKNNVTLAEIEWVVKQLRRQGYSTSSKSNDHQVLFRVENVRFGVCSHHSGQKQIKACYVEQFLNAMITLELYDE